MTRLNPDSAIALKQHIGALVSALWLTVSLLLACLVATRLFLVTHTSKSVYLYLHL